MKEIFLTQGQVALVDDIDYERLNCFKWCAQKDKNTFYARRYLSKKNGKSYMIQMHHEILGIPPKGLITDHRDGNGLNDQRENLRFVTYKQNNQNRKNQESSSKYPGVCWYKTTNKWIANIRINGKQKHLGFFADELEAFEAYRKAVEANGETVI